MIFKSNKRNEGLMNTKSKKVKILGAGLLAFMMLTNPYMPIASAADAPQDAKAVLLTPYLDATNTSEAGPNQLMADGWVKNGWFGSGLIYQRTFIPVSSTINLTYLITDKNGAPLANTPVKLRVNKGYSQSTSIIEVDGIRTKGVDKPPADQALVTHVTDAFGYVSFEVKNLDQAPMGEPEPDSLTSAPKISEDGLNDLHSQMLLQIAGEKPDHSVITEFHYYIPKKTIAYSTTNPSIKLVAPILNEKNSISLGTNSKAIYAPTGSSTIVAYKVSDDNGLALPGATVQIKVGTSTLSAVSDAMGYAVFTIKDAHTKGETKPATMTTKPPTSGAVLLSISPTIVGSSSVVADNLQIHYYTATPTKAAPTTIKCVKGAVIKKVTAVNPTCPKGYKKS